MIFDVVLTASNASAPSAGQARIPEGRVLRIGIALPKLPRDPVEWTPQTEKDGLLGHI